MSYTGTDGDLHVSTQEEADPNFPLPQWYKVDDPYPDPKYYPGDIPMPDATQAQINDVVNQWPNVLETLYALTKNVSGEDPAKSAADARTWMSAIDKTRFVFG